jgi:hypothetical protein
LQQINLAAIFHEPRRVTPKRGKSAQIKAEDEHTLERTRKVREACAQASNAELRRFNRFRHEKSGLADKIILV